MSGKPTKINEAALHAYLDGVLEEERRLEVEAYLDANPAEADRLRAYEMQNEALRSHAQASALEPISPRLRRLARGRGVFSPLRLAMAAAWLLIGGLGGWSLHGLLLPGAVPETALWKQARVAHLVFTPEVAHPVEVTADREKHLVAWLSKRLGKPLPTPRLSPAGFELMGGRLLASHSGPAAQFMFENASGKRLTLYVRRNAGESATAAFRYGREGSVGVVSWTDGSLGYALSGDLKRPRLLRAAESLHQQGSRS